MLPIASSSKEAYSMSKSTLSLGNREMICATDAPTSRIWECAIS